MATWERFLQWRHTPRPPKTTPRFPQWKCTYCVLIAGLLHNRYADSRSHFFKHATSLCCQDPRENKWRMSALKQQNKSNLKKQQLGGWVLTDGCVSACSLLSGRAVHAGCGVQTVEGGKRSSASFCLHNLTSIKCQECQSCEVEGLC